MSGGAPSARVLLVEDRASVRAVLAAILEPLHRVTACADGAAALALVEEAAFDLMITDVRMPGLGGLELVGEVRRRAPGTRVLVMTAWANGPDAAAALALGACDYLAKPVDADELLLAVARALDPGPEDPAPLAPPGREDEAALRRAEAAREAGARRWLLALLRACGEDPAAAAGRAGLAPAALQRLLDRYGASPGATLA